MDPKIAKHKTEVLLYNRDTRNLYLSHLNTQKNTPKTKSQNNPYKNIMLKYIQNSMCDFLNILLNKNKIQNITYNIFLKKTSQIDYSNIIIQHQNSPCWTHSNIKRKLILHNITQKQSYSVSNFKIEHKQT
jgi:hypothetical protein